LYRTGAVSGNMQLTWVDREGKVLGPLGPGMTAINSSVALSPDGKRVAYDGIDPSGNRDIWIADLARGVPSRFTFDAAIDDHPLWSPDGSQIYFSSDRRAAGLHDIYRKNSDGSGEEQLVVKAETSTRPLDISPDGRSLVYSVIGSGSQRLDIGILPLGVRGEPGKPSFLIQTPFLEGQAQISPDGRWIAYVTDDAGPNQIKIYVQPFPSGGGKFQISGIAGGTHPRWRRDGKEIFYLASDGKLMAVDVRTTPAFEAGQPKALFDSRLIALGLNSGIRYVTSADGMRFLINGPPANATAATEAGITVVVNWQAAVAR
jgi:eukaryotic-like serine/threonine-protein kinase